MADEHAMTTSLHRAAVPGIGAEVSATIGAAGAILAIVGLAGILPQLLADVGVILVGAAHVTGQGSAAGRYELALTSQERQQLRGLPLGGSVTGEFVGGMAAALLGLLSLLGIAQTPLLAIAVILLGAVEISSGRSLARLTTMMIEAANVEPRVKAVAREASGASMGAVFLIGMGGVALGILAIVITPSTLSLVLAGTLALGLGTLLEAASRSEHLAAA